MLSETWGPLLFSETSQRNLRHFLMPSALPVAVTPQGTQREPSRLSCISKISVFFAFWMQISSEISAFGLPMTNAVPSQVCPFRLAYSRFLSHRFYGYSYSLFFQTFFSQQRRGDKTGRDKKDESWIQNSVTLKPSFLDIGTTTIVRFTVYRKTVSRGTVYCQTAYHLSYTKYISPVYTVHSLLILTLYTHKSILYSL